jgi:hypothetical protein
MNRAPFCLPPAMDARTTTSIPRATTVTVTISPEDQTTLPGLVCPLRRGFDHAVTCVDLCAHRLAPSPPIAAECAQPDGENDYAVGRWTPPRRAPPRSASHPQPAARRQNSYRRWPRSLNLAPPLPLAQSMDLAECRLEPLERFERTRIWMGDLAWRPCSSPRRQRRCLATNGSAAPLCGTCRCGCRRRGLTGTRVGMPGGSTGAFGV